MSVRQGRTRRSRIPTRQPSGLYVHSSPPTAIPVHPSVVRQWLRGGEIGRLTDLVLKGQGQTLVGEYSPDTKARKFIHVLPKILKRIDTLHEAAKRNDLNTINEILSKEPKINLELSRDISGLGLLHKAVIHNYVDLQKWLLNNYPSTVTVLDKEKRSALHYAGGTEHPEDTWKLLVSSGADINTVDSEGYTPAFYMHHPRRLRPPAPDSRGATSKRPNSLQNMIVKPSTIRIWIHDKDLGRLQKVLWEGLGDRLKTETSTNPVVRRFLNAVPYIMGSIREIHTAAINNDLELLKARSQDPVPKDILLSRDINGLTPLHKAAGLGHIKIAKEILKKAPEAANVKDFYDRTPLHYAAALKDKGEMFQLLADAGSVDHLEDKKGNTPSYYRGKPVELDGPKLLNVIPDAPRTAHIFPPSWDWRLLGGKDPEPDAVSPLASPMETSQIEGEAKAPENKETGNEREDEEEQAVSASQEEEQEENASPRPDVSEDEGVGSEVPVSGEEMTSPSDATNEEYEESQESRLVDSLFADLGVNSENGEIISDSGNEEEAREEAETEEVIVSRDEHEESLFDTEGNKVSNGQTAGEDINDLEQTKNQQETLDTDTPEEEKNSGEQFGAEINSEETAPSLSYITLNNTIQTSYSEERLKTADMNKHTDEVKDEDKTDDLHIKNETSNSSEDFDEFKNTTNEDNLDDNVFINETTENEELQENAEIKETLTSTEEKSQIKEENETNRVSSSSSGELVPIRSISRRVEILAITPADPEEVDEPDLQEAVARGIPEVDRQRAYELVRNGDMEAMAELVLSGQGASLLGLASDNPDVQLFINNVPHYMAKIERVHKSAREGDLRGVQTALDRRKFAVARDNSTPLKPTPLHVAALFGRTNVLRYLAGRFPETMHAQDSAGRTPLHYAATLPDNGHFFSLLVTLGADKAFTDNAGKTAEEYLRNKEDLTRETLLKEYQNRDVPIDMSGLNFNRYSDKGAELIREGYPIFNTEDGQYLAATLGEPLIKGLTEVAQVRPKNPVVHLAHYLLSYNDENDLRKSISSANEEKLEVDISLGGNYNPDDDEGNNNQEEEEEKVNDEQNNEEDVVDENDEIEKLNEVDVEGNHDEDDNGSDTVDEPAFKPINRDEHGQSMIHFAAARSHGRNAMFQLLEELDANVGIRDSLYRTARDIAEQVGIDENIKSIDKYVVTLAARGEDEKLQELIVEGYDHIVDTADDDKNIIDIVKEREQESTLKLLQGISAFQERREKLHRAIRFGSWQNAQEVLNESESARRLALAKNLQGRCSLHVAVLNQNETIVEHISKKYPATLQIGDNLMRTPLHYAMGVEKVEPLSRILIASGAQRVVKDLKGRQPSYYFMNKTDIQKLQDEEETLRV